MFNLKTLSLWITLLMGVGVFSSSALHADYISFEGEKITQGQLRIPDSECKRLSRTTHKVTKIPQARSDRFILEETRVNVEISGVLARVRMEQVFKNPYSHRLEAFYVFPLPENAAVDAYSFQVGETVIQGVVKEKEEARREYQQARSEGRKTALLEQERANIFTQSIANISPDGEVRVHIEYVHPIKVEGKGYVFRFPMVVGPRYNPGQPQQRGNLGRGWARDTDQVPDASRITPIAVPAGMRIGNDVFINVSIDAGMPIQKIIPVTHEIDIKNTVMTQASISLKNKSTIANKDFVLEYHLAGEKTTLASLVHKKEGAKNGYLSLVLQPKNNIQTEELLPREVVLLLDRSGSMNGPAISQLRILAGQILASLNPQDSFRIVVFSNDTSEFNSDPLPASVENIENAQQFIRSIHAGGGTNMLPAMKAALRSGRGEASQPRYLIMISDALVGNDDSILGYLNHKQLDFTRVFPIAVGAAPNHYLIQRTAELGRGFSMHVTNNDNASEMAKKFNQKTSTPYITDLEIDWGDLKVEQMIPSRLPDLYAGEALFVSAKYTKPGKSKVRLKGNLGGREVQLELDLELPEKELNHDALGSIWARQRIRQIWNENLGKQNPKAKEEITRLGLEHQLVTQYTSFVATEKEASTDKEGKLLTQDVPVRTPEGMDPNKRVARGSTPVSSAPAQKPVKPVVQQPQYKAAPQTQNRPTSNRQTSSRRRRSFGGGGGCVEWVFLGGLAGLGACRIFRRRDQKEA